MDWFSFFSADAGKTTLAGAAGGLVRWMTLRENWRDGIVSLGIGAICSLYLGPIIFPLLNPVLSDVAPAGDVGGLAAFIVGLGGISLTGALIDLIRARGKGLNK